MWDFPQVYVLTKIYDRRLGVVYERHLRTVEHWMELSKQRGSGRVHVAQNQWSVIAKLGPNTPSEESYSIIKGGGSLGITNV